MNCEFVQDLYNVYNCNTLNAVRGYDNCQRLVSKYFAEDILLDYGLCRVSWRREVSGKFCYVKMRLANCMKLFSRLLMLLRSLSNVALVRIVVVISIFVMARRFYSSQNNCGPHHFCYLFLVIHNHDLVTASEIQ